MENTILEQPPDFKNPLHNLQSFINFNNTDNSDSPDITMDKRENRFFLILACFFFSGLTGLIYEILWTRMIVKIIGRAPFAESIILAIFMDRRSSPRQSVARSSIMETGSVALRQ